MTARIALRVLRFQVAAVPIQFLVLFAALHGRLGEWRLLPAAIAIAACFVVATSVNDVWDQATDRANFLPAGGRPLLDGSATPSAMLRVATLAAGVALLAAAVIGPAAVAVVLVALVLDVAYSVPPVRLTARPLLAVPTLAVTYACVPAALSLAAVGRTPTRADLSLAAATTLLMAARLVLKDFRDVAGDAATGKRTFLLVYGKGATVAVSLVTALVGGLLALVVLLPLSPPGSLGFGGLLVLALSCLRGVAMAREPAAAARWVAVGARTAQGAVLAAAVGLALAGAQGPRAADSAVLVLAVGSAYTFIWRRLRSEVSDRGEAPREAGLDAEAQAIALQG